MLRRLNSLGASVRFCTPVPLLANPTDRLAARLRASPPASLLALLLADSHTRPTTPDAACPPTCLLVHLLMQQRAQSLASCLSMRPQGRLSAHLPTTHPSCSHIVRTPGCPLTRLLARLPATAPLPGHPLAALCPRLVRRIVALPPICAPTHPLARSLQCGSSAEHTRVRQPAAAAMRRSLSACSRAPTSSPVQVHTHVLAIAHPLPPFRSDTS